MRRVATFLLRSGLRVDSARSVALLPLMQQALRDTGVWLNGVHGGLSVPVYGQSQGGAGFEHEPTPDRAQGHLALAAGGVADAAAFCADVKRQM